MEIFETYRAHVLNWKSRNNNGGNLECFLFLQFCFAISEDFAWKGFEYDNFQTKIQRQQKPANSQKRFVLHFPPATPQWTADFKNPHLNLILSFSWKIVKFP